VGEGASEVGRLYNRIVLNLMFMPIHEPRLPVLLALRKPLRYVSLLDLVGKARRKRSEKLVIPGI